MPGLAVNQLWYNETVLMVVSKVIGTDYIFNFRSPFEIEAFRNTSDGKSMERSPQLLTGMGECSVSVINHTHLFEYGCHSARSFWCEDRSISRIADAFTSTSEKISCKICT